MIDTKKARLSEFFFVEIAISHATIDKANVEEGEIKILGK